LIINIDWQEFLHPYRTCKSIGLERCNPLSEMSIYFRLSILDIINVNIKKNHVVFASRNKVPGLLSIYYQLIFKQIYYKKSESVYYKILQRLKLFFTIEKVS